MESKKIVLWIFISAGGIVGAYLPTWLFQADPAGIWGILGGMAGGVLGIWAWFKLGRM